MPSSWGSSRPWDGTFISYVSCMCRWVLYPQRHLELAYQWKRCGFHLSVRKIPQSRKWQQTPVFLPGKFRGQRSLAGFSPWGCKELNTIERLSTHTAPPGNSLSLIPNILTLNPSITPLYATSKILFYAVSHYFVSLLYPFFKFLCTYNLTFQQAVPI